jgi:hypothetical protein
MTCYDDQKLTNDLERRSSGVRASRAAHPPDQGRLRDLA